MINVALTIAGSDSSGGAGVQADLKTFTAFGVYGASAITALTAQNTCGVAATADLDASFVAAQIDAVVDDFAVGAAKTGMLSRGAVIDLVADRIRTRAIPNVVVDPVMVAASGDVLLDPGAVASMREHMFPLAIVVTPNLREAEILVGRTVTDIAGMRRAARELVRMGAKAALVTGGALDGDALDVFFDGHEIHELASPRVRKGRVHGAGCTLSAGIAACLARGDSLPDAIASAKRYVTRAIEAGPPLGHGSQPLDHLVAAFGEKPSRQ
ncbi:MAG TPA: bifunctional hydroxymethylpyrimidine kinase/phosphomethylpyrimidine kinase [Candidatus Binataceae bacterium]|nr:bifunctional hydroxymethylpyrimidine kinase/phosphomethylpyrimidine kinase [Candidatus Binataceae bacterium]